MKVSSRISRNPASLQSRTWAVAKGSVFRRLLQLATYCGLYPHSLRGPFGEALSTDVALIGNPKAKHLLVALSGTHGVEGYYGSDCQRQLLHDLSERSLPDDVAVLMIYLINPWGTAWMRRINEDNIDLNRNNLNFSQTPPDNQAYEALHEVYTCEQLPGPRRDQWLHLHGDLFSSEARQIKLKLLEQFFPADRDWQELVWVGTRQIWKRC
ncbi:DUF2817 domain-containing protein [Pseudomonas sp.]|uniref:DUF2817 domain-containing protein n=1 Tax=Pseudomonas sp. TaxID=306 RepID=UPI003263E735